MEDVVWMGPQPALAERMRSVGVERSLDPEALGAWLAGREVHYLPPYHADRVLFLADLLGRTSAEIRTGHSQALVMAVIDQRLHKQPEEIAQMEEALMITALIHRQVRTSVGPGKFESQLRGIAEGVAFAHQGRLAYQAICTIQGQTLHTHIRRKKAKGGYTSDGLLVNVVRNPDGIHFCPASGEAVYGITDDCPEWSSGAYRYGRALAQPVLDALAVSSSD